MEGGRVNCHLFRAFMGYGEQAHIQASCRGKSDGISKVDKKYSSGYRKKGGRERNEEGAIKRNKAKRQKGA